LKTDQHSFTQVEVQQTTVPHR